MKTFKRTAVCLMLIIVASITFAPTFTAFASGHGHVKKILGQLNLTEDQKAKIKVIMKDAREQNKDKGDRTREEKIELTKDIEAKIKAVLTPEQQQKYDQLRAEMKEKRRGKQSKLQ